MSYDRETQRVLPADGCYAAAPVRVLAGVALGILLFAATLGLGYLVVVWLRRARVSTVTAASRTAAVHRFWAAAPRPSSSRPL